MIKLLKQLFVDTFALYYITHLFHWNITGSNFVSLHSLFQEQYENLWNAIDDIAERIRQQDELVDCTLVDITEKTELSILSNSITKDGKDMISVLLKNNQRLSEWLREAINQSSKDLVTQNYFIDRKTYHDKQIWKLESLLK